MESDTSQILQWLTFGLAAVSVVVSALVALLVVLLKRNVDRSILAYQSRLEWKRRSLEELMGPVCTQLQRTEAAFGRWKPNDRYLETEVVRSSNQEIRDLLLHKGDLIPPELRDHAIELIVHYDVWLQKYEELRGAGSESTRTSGFVFVGPDGYPFPTSAAERFQDHFRDAWAELYGKADPR